MWRLVKGQTLCADWGQEPEAVERNVRATFEKDDFTYRDRSYPGIMVADASRPVVHRDDPMILPNEFNDIVAALPGVAKVVATENLTASFVPASLPSTTPRIEKVPLKVEMTGLLGPTTLEGKAQSSIRTEDTATRRDAIRAAYSGSSQLVLGSFNTADMAERLARLYRDQGARVAAADVDGKRYYRVVVAPRSADQVKAVQDRMADAGIGRPWVIGSSPDGSAKLAKTPPLSATR
jgi:hypothetical protein